MRNHTVATIIRHKASAIIRADDQQLAHDAMQAAVDGGFRLVEFTLTTPGAFELIATFSKMPGLCVGAGTVLTEEQVTKAEAAGARFIVSPICDPQIIASAHAVDCVAVPGTSTPTEMQTAYLHGAEFCKLFPAPADVPAFIRAVRGPLPNLKIYPTNGVTLENVAAVLRAGAAGVGFVAPLFDPALMAARDMTGITRRARALLDAVAGVE